MTSNAGYATNQFQDRHRRTKSTKQKETRNMKMTSTIAHPALAVILAAATYLAILSAAQAALNPPPDGGYPGFNTAEGQNALKNLTSGIGNTGLGWYSLFAVGGGSYNTGIGAGALILNTGDQNTAIGVEALLSNHGAVGNTATGFGALLYNDSTGNGVANWNSAFGAM